MAPTISVFGCGWLGLPLAVYLVTKGYKVKGSTTSFHKMSLLTEKKIYPFLINVDDAPHYMLDNAEQDFFNCDVLVINIPPKIKTQGDHYHPQQIDTVLRYSKKFSVRKIIFISATSVYPPDNEIIDENTILNINTTGNKALFQAEKKLEQENGIVIFRCGGLLGHDRIPGRYYSGKAINTGNTPVNYIHRDDVVRIIEKSIRKDNLQGVFNLVAPLHPSRKDVFTKNAIDFGFDPPKFNKEAEPVARKKMVLGTKIIAELPYKFLYPDPLDFSYTR